MSYESDYSDLTDLDQDDFAGNRTKGAAKSKYKIRNVLKVPRTTTYPTQALYDQILTGDINLEPEYQRDVVWPESKQIGVIDSIFRNFYIPPVIFAVNTFEDGTETRTCIDGKQRLTSIFKFMDGSIPHKDPLTNDKLWFKGAGQTTRGARSRKMLPEKYCRLFSNKQIVCVEYQGITDSDEREIFQRVQLGMALTPAEKLQVISGARADFVRRLQSIFLSEKGGLGGDALEWDRSRGNDFRCLAQSLFSIAGFPDLKGVPSISQLEKWLATPEELPTKFCENAYLTYQVFQDLVQDPKLSMPFRKPTKVSPIEFIMSSLLISVYKDRVSLAQLSAALGGMRDGVRREHVDIRMNGRVAWTMINFIKGIRINRLPGAGIECAAMAVTRKRKRDPADEPQEGPLRSRTKISTGGPYPSSSRRSDSPDIPLAARQHLPPPIHPKQNYPTSSAPRPPPPPSTSLDRLAVMRAAKQNMSLHAGPHSSSTFRSHSTPIKPMGSASSLPQQHTTPGFQSGHHKPADDWHNNRSRMYEQERDYLLAKPSPSAGEATRNSEQAGGSAK